MTSKSKKKIQRQVQRTKKKTSRVKRNIDSKLLGFANKSVEQLKAQVQKKAPAELDTDIVKQLGRIILNKAQTIRKVLTADEFKKGDQKEKSTPQKKEKNRENSRNNKVY